MLGASRSTQHNDTTSASALPAIRVLDAFTSGGAGQSGARVAKQFQIAQNVDFTIGKRQTLRAGVALERGWWDSTNRSNSNGTYTFSNLADYNAGTPATYTRRTGDPLVAYSLLQGGWYLQDDVRLSKSFSVGLGVRQEAQTQVNDKWNLAPRAAFTWNVDRTTVVRGGYGLFYDWFDSNLYEQTLRVDGTHQVDLVVTNPGFPAVEGHGVSLPPSVIRSASLTQPFNAPLLFGIRAGINLQASSATPYTITTGRDPNADTVFNDRPAGVERNSERGAAQFNGTVRFTRSLAIGGAAAGVPGRPGGTPSGGGDASIGSVDGGRSARYRTDMYAQLSNPFNYVNYNTFVGNQLSPFFGRATSAGSARRVELGMSLSF